MIPTEKKQDLLFLITGHEVNAKEPGLFKKYFKLFESTLFKNSVFVLNVFLK